MKQDRKMLNDHRKKIALFLSTSFCALTIISGILMVFTGIHVFKPHQNHFYRDTQCTVLEQLENGTTNCSCSKDKKNKDSNPDCRSSYPCVRVMVSYNVINETDSTNVSSILSDDQTIDSEEKEVELEERRRKPDYRPQECSIVPLCYANASENNRSVQLYLDKYGKPGTAFICFYDPKDNKHVKVYPFDRSSRNKAFLYYFAMAFFVLSSIGCSISFKWYKMLLLQDHQDICAVQVVAAPASPGMPPSYPQNELKEENAYQQSYLQPPSFKGADTGTPPPPPPPYSPTPANNLAKVETYPIVPET